VEIRALVALAATLVCAAMAAHATSAVQTAREQQPPPPEATVEDPATAAPESPLGIAGALAGDAAAVQIQLGAANSEPRPASLLDVEVVPH